MSRRGKADRVDAVIFLALCYLADRTLRCRRAASFVIAALRAEGAVDTDEALDAMETGWSSTGCSVATSGSAPN